MLKILCTRLVAILVLTNLAAMPAAAADPIATQPLRGSDATATAINEAEEVECCADCCDQTAGGCGALGGLCSFFQCCFVCCELAN